MKRIPGFGIVLASFMATMIVYQAGVIYDQRVNGFAGVGGPEEFARQRAIHLERLAKNDHVNDPKVRAQDAAAIDSELDDLRLRLPAQELGDELKRIR